MRYHPFGQVPIRAQIEPISARWASSSTLISTLMRSRRSPRWLTIATRCGGDQSPGTRCRRWVRQEPSCHVTGSHTRCAVVADSGMPGPGPWVVEVERLVVPASNVVRSHVCSVRVGCVTDRDFGGAAVDTRYPAPLVVTPPHCRDAQAIARSVSKFACSSSPSTVPHQSKPPTTVNPMVFHLD